MVGLPYAWAFGEASGGRPQEVQREKGGSGDTLTFRRVEPATYTREERAAFEGRYYSDELEVHYRILGTGDSLHLKQGHREPRPLRPGVKDEFYYNQGVIRFSPSDQETPTGFTLSTRRNQGIRFERTQ